MEQENKKKIPNDLFKTLSDYDKVLFIISENPGITRKDISQTVIFVNPVNLVNQDNFVLDPKAKTRSCYSVIPVNLVNQVNTTDNTNNINNTNNRITPVSEPSCPENTMEDEDINKIGVYINRLILKNMIEADKSDKWHKYTVTKEGKAYCDNLTTIYEEKILSLSKSEQKESDIVDKIEFFKDYLKTINLLGEPVVMDVKTLSKRYPSLVDNLIDNPEETMKIISIALEGLGYEKRSVVLINVPSSVNHNITNLRADKLNKLVRINGELVSRSQTRFTVKSIIFECPGCGNTITVLQNDTSLKEPTKCGCGRKGKFRTLKRDIVDSLGITLRDMYESIPPGIVPEEVDCLFEKDIFNFSSLNEGDRIAVIGILVDIPMTTKANIGNTVNYSKMLKVLGIERLDNKFTLGLISDADMDKFSEIKIDPTLWHNTLFFNDLHEVAIYSRILFIALYGGLNLISVGDSGSGKSEMQKRIINNISRGAWVVISGNQSASVVGILGSASKNPFTGKYSLSGGVLRPMHPKGIVGIDEVNRDKDFEIQSALLGVMNDRRLNIHKADINVDTPCDVTIWGTANPVNGVFDNYKKEYDNFAILPPLWDRTDLIVYYTAEAMLEDSLILELFEKHKSFFIPYKDDAELFRKYLLYSSTINVTFSKDDKRKLVGLYKNFYSALNPGKGFRRVDTLNKMLLGICRINHRTSPIDDDFKMLSDIILDLKLCKDNYISSQRDI